MKKQLVTISLLLILSNGLYAATPVQDMTCTDYLGIDLNTKDSEKSEAYMAGLKIGVSLRQASMSSWVHGYLSGYRASQDLSRNDGIDMSELRSKMRLRCNDNQAQTMRQLAESLKDHM